MNESKLKSFLRGFRGLYAAIGLITFIMLAIISFSTVEEYRIPIWASWTLFGIIILLGELFYYLDIKYKIFYPEDFPGERFKPSEYFIILKIVNIWRAAGALGMIAALSAIIYGIISGIITIFRDPKTLTTTLTIILIIGVTVTYFVSNYYLAKHLEKKPKKVKKK